MKITRMRVNHLEEPLGFRYSSTMYSWVVEEADGKIATASRIVVTSDGATVADTGWAQLDSLAASVDVPLKPRTRYEWTVAVRTDADEEALSPVASFETGKMDEPWSAQWIVCDGAESPRHPIFSRTIALAGEVLAARLYACGLGFYDASIDGARVGDEYLAPGTNAYDRWLQVQTYDVTGQLRAAGEAEMPEVYLACGTDDGFIASTRALRDQLTADGVTLTYDEQPGGHEWDFWDAQIKKIIDWLPLDEADQGFGSGAID